MEDQLVTFDTAVLAKEKGFNEQTYSNCWLKTLNGNIIHNSERRSIFEHDRCEQFLMQPSQPQLHKWLRDEKNIFIEITVGEIHKFFWSRVIDLNTLLPVSEWESGNRTYEDAMEQGLKEGLKLIKI